MNNIDYVIMAIGSIITFYIELFAYAKLSNNKYKINFKNIIIPIIGGIIVIFNIYTTDAFVRAFLNPVKCVPPSGVLILFTNVYVAS